jgi:hypothetical protein
MPESVRVYVTERRILLRQDRLGQLRFWRRADPRIDPLKL